jgi:hypothetical protein
MTQSGHHWEDGGISWLGLVSEGSPQPFAT